MDGWNPGSREGYITKVIETPSGTVIVHRPQLDERTRAQRTQEVIRALQQLAHGGKV